MTLWYICSEETHENWYPTSTVTFFGNIWLTSISLLTLIKKIFRQKHAIVETEFVMRFPLSQFEVIQPVQFKKKTDLEMIGLSHNVKLNELHECQKSRTHTCSIYATIFKKENHINWILNAFSYFPNHALRGRMFVRQLLLRDGFKRNHGSYLKDIRLYNRIDSQEN